MSIQAGDVLPPAPALLCEATPLAGVDMIEAEKDGIVLWRVRAGDYVAKDQILGEIVDVEDFTAPRTPIITRTSGIVYGVRLTKFVHPGEIVIKVAGPEALAWRQGLLLTS